MPVLISPTGVQAVHPDGEVAVARAAAARGTAMGLSSFASKPVEEVVAANPQVFFQIYWMGDRAAMEARLERARAAGCVGLILTLDWSFSHSRDWGSPVDPRRDRPQDDGDLRPRGRPEAGAGCSSSPGPRSCPTSACPTCVPRRAEPPKFFGAYGEWMGTPPPSWEDVAWLRETWGGPFMLKGISRLDDARAAVDAGVTAISVSNHGGNNLDGTPAPIRVLPAIADAVGRRGRDPARRRHPPGQRRGQGRGPRRPGGDDRPGLPVGPVGQRPGRRGERPRHPARRHRLRPAGPGPLARSPTSPPTTSSSPRASPGSSATPSSDPSAGRVDRCRSWRGGGRAQVRARQEPAQTPAQ